MLVLRQKITCVNSETERISTSARLQTEMRPQIRRRARFGDTEMLLERQVLHRSRRAWNSHRRLCRHLLSKPHEPERPGTINTPAYLTSARLRSETPPKLPLTPSRLRIRNLLVNYNHILNQIWLAFYSSVDSSRTHDRM